MSEVTTTETTTEERHLTAEHVADVKKLFGESRPAIASRIKWLDATLAYGVDVKTLAADLKEANRTDPAVPVLSQAMLGYYRFPITIAETVGVTLAGWLKRNPEQVEAVYYAGKHAGLKRAGQAIRDAIKPIAAEKKPEREEAATAAAEILTAEVKPVKASTPRGKSGEEKSGKSAPNRVLPAAADASVEDVLAAIRYATAAINLGMPHSADLASAVAELTAATTAARKRGAEKRRTVATPATVAEALTA
jgi:hypothetical protein